MARKKDMLCSVRLTEKNTVYLSKAGYIDGRTGKKKRGALNLNEFMNTCITTYLEKYRKPVQDMVSTEQLKMSWIDHEIDKLAAEAKILAVQQKTLNDERKRLIDPSYRPEPQLDLQVFIQDIEALRDDIPNGP